MGLIFSKMYFIVCFSDSGRDILSGYLTHINKNSSGSGFQVSTDSCPIMDQISNLNELVVFFNVGMNLIFYGLFSVLLSFRDVLLLEGLLIGFVGCVDF